MLLHPPGHSNRHSAGFPTREAWALSAGASNPVDAVGCRRKSNGSTTNCPKVQIWLSRKSPPQSIPNDK